MKKPVSSTAELHHQSQKAGRRHVQSLRPGTTEGMLDYLPNWKKTPALKITVLMLSEL